MRCTTTFLILTVAVATAQSGRRSVAWHPEAIALFTSSSVHTQRQFVSDVPAELESFVSGENNNRPTDSNGGIRCAQKSENQNYRKREINISESQDNDVAQYYEHSIQTNVNVACQALKNRAKARAELVSILFQRRKRSLRTAMRVVTNSARRSPTVRVLSDCHAILYGDNNFKSQRWAANNAHRSPSLLNRGYKTCLAAVRSRRGSSDKAEEMNRMSILTEDERLKLIERSAQLMDNVQYALENDAIWEQIIQKEGVTVWRTYADVKNFGANGCAQSQNAADGATIRSETYMDASPDKVFQLLTDDDRVHEYNDNCVELADIEILDHNTKINWCATGKFGPFKARDFVTLVHFRPLEGEDGYISLAANIEHSKLPPANGYVRSEIQLSAMFMRPVPGNPNKTHIVQMTQVGQLGGAADSAVAKKITQNLSEKAPVDFMKKFNNALMSSPVPRPKSKSGPSPFIGVGKLNET